MNAPIYIGLWVVPAHEITIAVDGLVFKTIEWWSGTNPIDAPRTFTPRK